MNNNINTLLNSLSDSIHRIRKADKNIGEYSSISDNTMAVGTPSVPIKDPVIITQHDLDNLCYSLYYAVEDDTSCLIKNSDTSTNFVFTADSETDYSDEHPEERLYYNLVINIRPEKDVNLNAWYVYLPIGATLDELVKNDIIQCYRMVGHEVVKSYGNDVDYTPIKLQYNKDFVFEDGCSLIKTQEYMDDDPDIGHFPIQVSYDENAIGNNDEYNDEYNDDWDLI